MATPGLASASSPASTGGVVTPLALSERPLSQDSSSASGPALTEGVQEPEVEGAGDRRGLLEEEDSTSSRGCSEAMTNDCLISEEERFRHKFRINACLYSRMYNTIFSITERVQLQPSTEPEQVKIVFFYINPEQENVPAPGNYNIEQNNTNKKEG